jgi:hypothetical protein
VGWGDDDWSKRLSSVVVASFSGGTDFGFWSTIFSVISEGVHSLSPYKQV